MGGSGAFSKVPGGNVPPSRFVKLQTDNTVIVCAANDSPWGISQASTRNAPLSGLDDGYAGILGDPAINIFGPGCDSAQLEIGGTVSVGQRLKATTAGIGIAATTDKDAVGAIAQRSGVSGDIIPVKPIRYDISV